MTDSGGTHVPEPVATEPTAPRLRILHLSDLVLTAQVPASSQVLGDLLDDLRFLRDVDLVVVSGDVVGDAASATYVAARRTVGGFASAHGAAHVYALGDRDDHTGFADILGSGHLAADGIDVGESGPEGERRGWCSDLDGLRVVTLDTTVPGARHGQLGESQAQWLGEVLRTPSPRGSVVVLHHSPVSPHGHRHLAALTLRDPERLADAIRGSDVHVILAGHVGLQLGGMLGGVPVLVAPAVAARTDLSAPDHLSRTVRGAGAQVVDLGGPFSPQSHTVWARDARAGELLELRDPVTGQAVAGETLSEPPPDVPAATGASLSERIPRGSTPAPGAGTGPSSWPAELDSSTRAVSGTPDGGKRVRTEPVWLEDTEAMTMSTTASPVTSSPSPEPPASVATPAPSPPAPPAQGWAPEPLDDPGSGDPVATEPADEGLGTDDSGVLSWAFAEADDEGEGEDEARTGRRATQPRPGPGL